MHLQNQPRQRESNSEP